LTPLSWFDTSKDMKKPDALTALAALAQESRLDIYRLLVRAGTNGLPAGHIGEQLGLPSPTLAFHLKQLRHSGLVTSSRDGRSLIYAAVYPAMTELLAFLTENCCQGNPAACGLGETVGTPPPAATSGDPHEAPACACVGR
jgi:DNA-binding transcriptional ArsR family regulator